MSPSNQDEGKLLGALRAAVREALKGDEADVTVNAIRAAAEEDLSLPEGFFKAGDWKTKSKQVIQKEFEGDSSSQIPPAAPSTKQSGKSKIKTDHVPTPAVVRDRSKKRRRDVDSSSTEDLTQESSASDLEPMSEPEPKKSKKSKVSSRSQTKKTDVKSPEPKEVPNTSKSVSLEVKKPQAKAVVHEDSESELSDLPKDIDEPIPKKRSANAKAEKPAKPRPKGKDRAAATDSNLSPDEAEIKRLQSWLLKCGIRKLWHRELAPFDSPRAKIKHLKGMLAEAGMEGRYSVEKARQIKEERELKADVEEVNRMNSHWGDRVQSNDEQEAKGQEDEPTKPKRTLARGLKGLEMFDDDDDDDDESD
ncbi:MAG: hypothetical protein M1814_004061 [Vezdaea aestivalis]|nr:MAG: hypothetical protein M1814_004061 [Vezdaea aestivalis]